MNPINSETLPPLHETQVNPRFVDVPFIDNDLVVDPTDGLADTSVDNDAIDSTADAISDIQQPAVYEPRIAEEVVTGLHIQDKDSMDALKEIEASLAELDKLASQSFTTVSVEAKTIIKTAKEVMDARKAELVRGRDLALAAVNARYNELLGAATVEHIGTVVEFSEKKDNAKNRLRSDSRALSIIKSFIADINTRRDEHIKARDEAIAKLNKLDSEKFTLADEIILDEQSLSHLMEELSGLEKYRDIDLPELIQDLTSQYEREKQLIRQSVEGLLATKMGVKALDSPLQSIANVTTANAIATSEEMSALRKSLIELTSNKNDEVTDKIKTKKDEIVEARLPIKVKTMRLDALQVEIQEIERQIERELDVTVKEIEQSQADIKLIIELYQKYINGEVPEINESTLPEQLRPVWLAMNIHQIPIAVLDPAYTEWSIPSFDMPVPDGLKKDPTDPDESFAEDIERQATASSVKALIGPSNSVNVALRGVLAVARGSASRVQAALTKPRLEVTFEKIPGKA